MTSSVILKFSQDVLYFYWFLLMIERRHLTPVENILLSISCVALCLKHLKLCNTKELYLDTWRPSLSTLQSAVHLQLYNLSTKLLYWYFFAVSLLQFLFYCYFYGLTLAKGSIVIMVGSHEKWLSLGPGFVSLPPTFSTPLLVDFSLY